MRGKILILPILLVLSIFLYPADGLAYEGGLIHGKRATSKNPSTLDDAKLTDGKLDTSFATVHGGHYAEWTLTNVSDINQYFAHLNPKTRISFYDVDKNLITSIEIQSARGFYATPETIVGVKYVRLTNVGSFDRWTEFDIYTEKLIGTGKPFDLQVSNITNTSAYLTWDSENSYFTIYRENGTVFDTNIKNMFYQFKNLQPETTYTFTMTRTDDSGAVSEHSDPITFRTLSEDEWAEHPENPDRTPDIPYNVSADVGDQEITISWDYERGYQGFYLYKNGQRVNNNMTAGLTTFSNDYLITSKTYTLRGLENGTRYSFQVSAVGLDGQEGQKSQVIYATPESLIPSIPTELSISNGDGLLNLRWRANPESNIVGYNIYLNGVKVNSEPVQTTSYRINGLENGTSYSVQISALNSYGNESPMTQVVQGLPKESFIPQIPINSNYNLKDIADSTSSWFGGLWLIIAFAVAIPLAFLISSRVKEMFIY